VEKGNAQIRNISQGTKAFAGVNILPDESAWDFDATEA
jgi:hypothetical protein